MPQDARLSEQYLKLAGLFGARYSHYPCVGGLYAVLRLIKDDSLQIPTFSMLGYHPEQERTCAVFCSALKALSRSQDQQVQENPPR